MASDFRSVALFHWGLWAALITLLIGPAPVAGEPLERGRELAQSLYDRPIGSDLTTRGTMVLIEEGREPRVRELLTYRKDHGSGQRATLIRFTAPGDIADTGLLTLDQEGGASDQWVYLPALGSSRRIPTARRGGRFVGSDLLYEDLQNRGVEMDQHRWIGTETYEGVATEMVESTPVDPGNSVYGRRITWVHPGIAVPLRIDFFRPGGGEPFKRFTVARVEQIQGYWIETDSTMQDLESRHRTRLVSSFTVFDRDLPDSLFSQRALEDPSHEQLYRPE